MSFNILSLFFTVGITLFCCLFIVRHSDWKRSFYYGLFYFFVLFYSGIGGCLSDTNPRYQIYYYVYIVGFTFFTFLFLKKRTIKTNSFARITRLNMFQEKYASTFIFLYITLGIMDLMYPVNRLSLLINPPMPDIQNRLSYYSDAASYTSFFSLIKLLLSPFFFWGLYKYRAKFLKLSGIMLFNSYLSYCADSYISRGSLLITLSVIFFTYYFSVTPKKQKELLFGATIAFPFLIIFFVIYSYIRVGQTAAGITFSGAFTMIFQQEIDSPLLFDSYINSAGNLIQEYFEWIFLLPLPSSLKMGYGGSLFNELFTNVALDSYNWQTGFSIALPGIVGEAIFIFNNYLLVHAFILSFVLCFIYKFISSDERYLVLYLYISMRVAQGLPRGGTQGLFSYFAKSILVFMIISYFISKISYIKKS